jgi:secondary thiamine-phosphate synthase enzyme
MFYELDLKTPVTGFVDITEQVKQLLKRSGIQEGTCQVFVPHTTAGVTINENADPDVVTDMLAALDAMVPDLPYLHGEGNSKAHVQASLVGSSVMVPVEGNALRLGIWQGIYVCEFDGPCKRSIYITVIGR